MTGRPLAPDDPRHGTPTGKKNHGCRCEPCRLADLEYQRKLRRSKGILPIREAMAKYQKHGPTRYRAGCHCDVCRAASAEEKRRHRATHRNHYRAYEKKRKRTKGGGT